MDVNDFPYRQAYRTYLQLEKALSPNSIEGYLQDVQKLYSFIRMQYPDKSFMDLNAEDLRQFLEWLVDFGISARSQARILSGIKTFYHFLTIENLVSVNPASLLESPRIPFKLPSALSAVEIDRMIASIDLSMPQGHRNQAIIELLYGGGLRVSELVHLNRSQISFKDEYLRIFGKGNKERIVPVGQSALKAVELYLNGYRVHLSPEKEFIDRLFLNNRGSELSRQMVFLIVRAAAKRAGIRKKVSPHTLRHSFASHLVEGGADIRAVQQMLGHESIMTTEIYLHMDRKFLQQTILKYHPRSRAGR